MYSVLPSFVLAFHGCDEAVAEAVFSGRSELKMTDNDYDWLGHRIYFWENNPARALDFAIQAQKHPQISKGKISSPAVIGAVINPGHCLNLLDGKFIQLLCTSYDALKKEFAGSGKMMPQNTAINKDGDIMLRKLDCAVIESVHKNQDFLAKEYKDSYEFDTVRGVFVEGKEIYLNSGFRDKNHIQICVRNTSCIKGYFRVRETIGQV
jgi:hypothetical protein